MSDDECHKSYLILCRYEYLNSNVLSWNRENLTSFYVLKLLKCLHFVLELSLVSPNIISCIIHHVHDISCNQHFASSLFTGFLRSKTNHSGDLRTLLAIRFKY